MARLALRARKDVIGSSMVFSRFGEGLMGVWSSLGVGSGQFIADSLVLV
jgi:hypothetical protein